jgi:hypothetical protein
VQHQHQHQQQRLLRQHDSFNWFISPVSLTIKMFYQKASQYSVEYFDGFGLTILGAFAKFRKATSNFVMSVRPHGTTRLPNEGLS